ncbi:hypothetical protein CVT26_005438 [Gymnopilus dilepis]|uniref:DUF6589 domain-containing protein n=1 Tax=Gymnopilus dilepis TaxID=231916 RepID=A0A409WC43_9AGAR|nr:hypothetical protein CVT26_005438 [Gymnopilus dilepis]
MEPAPPTRYPKGDRVLANSVTLMCDALMSQELSYAIAEGDAGRVYEIMKVLLLTFAGSSHNKYTTYLLESDSEGQLEEQAGISENAKGPAACQSLAIIRPIISVPSFITLEALKKALICIKHLPLNLPQPCVEVLMHLLIQRYGTEQLWSFDLSSDRIMEFFHHHFSLCHPFSSTTEGRRIILKSRIRSSLSLTTLRPSTSVPGAIGPSMFIVADNLTGQAAVKTAYGAIAQWSSSGYICLLRPFSNLSSNNWGNSEMCDALKAPKTIPPYMIHGLMLTRHIQQVVKKLSDNQWREVMTATHAFAVTKGKKRSRSSSGNDAATADGYCKG